MKKRKGETKNNNSLKKNNNTTTKLGFVYVNLSPIAYLVDPKKLELHTWQLD